MKISGTVGNTQLAAMPASDTLLIYDVSLTSATIPATCEAAATGTLLARFLLPTPWASTPSGGKMHLNGVPLTSAVILDGMPAYFRFVSSSSGICNMQGTVGRIGTQDENGQPWDLQIDGSRLLGATDVKINSIVFVAANNDA